MTDEEIDAKIMAGARLQWRKVAALLSNSDWLQLTEEKFDERLRGLISASALEVQGDPLRYRYSEVRLPAPL